MSWWAAGATTGSVTSPARPRLRRGLGFARRVVRVGARGVVGRVQHFRDLGELFLDQPLDPRLQRDVGGTTTLTAAAHLEIDAIVLDIDQLDKAPVTGNRGIDHRFDQLLNLRLEISTHGG